MQALVRPTDDPAPKPAAQQTEAAELAARVASAALALGFARVGFARAERFDEAADRFEAWLGAGYQGHMEYLEGPDPRDDPRSLLRSARTVISVALPYGGSGCVPLRRDRTATTPLVGTVARYAQGADYHRVLKDKLLDLGRAVAAIVGGSVAVRPCVDSAPLFEREAARRAGIGFTGKSTMTIVPGTGTFVVLGELLVDVEIEPASAPVAQGCGRCTACLDACPSGAFVGPYVLDARRCISYLTIETKGAIPKDLRRFIGARVFGCDVCQDVCPFNASDSPRPAAPELAPRPELENPELLDLLELSATGYRRLVRRTALRRVGRQQIQRNAAVALGNSGQASAVPPLVRALLADRSALVRAHAAWALGELGGDEARAALERAAGEDTDFAVRDEAREGARRIDESRSGSVDGPRP